MNKTTMTIEDFKNICRACIETIETDQNLKLVQITPTTMQLLDICTSIQTSADPFRDQFPPNICEKCLQQLSKISSFMDQCKKAYKYFQDIIFSYNENKIKQNDSDGYDEIDPFNDSNQNTDSELDKKETIFIKNEPNTSSTEKENDSKKQPRKKKIKIESDPEWHDSDDEKLKAKQEKIKTKKDKVAKPKKEKVRRKRILDPKRFQCDQCTQTFPFLFMKRRHQIVHVEEKNYTCEECSTQYKTAKNLKMHQERCHGEVPREICKLCGKLIKRYNMKRHLVHHQETRSFKCTECDLECEKRSRLEQHLKLMHNKILQVYKYLCTICGKNVVSPKDLENHMRVHTNERPYQCNRCDKNYKTASSLYTHVRFTHNKERPHSCQVCFKGFTTRGKLKRHSQSHSDSRPFECHVCGNTFRYDSALKTHLKMHCS